MLPELILVSTREHGLDFGLSRINQGSFFMIKAKNLILNVRLSFGRLGHDDLIFPLLSVTCPTNSDYEDFNSMELAGLHNGNGKSVLILTIKIFFKADRRSRNTLLTS